MPTIIELAVILILAKIRDEDISDVQSNTCCHNDLFPLPNQQLGNSQLLSLHNHTAVKTKYTHKHILVYFSTSGLTGTDLPSRNVTNKRKQKVRILLPIKAAFQCFVG